MFLPENINNGCLFFVYTSPGKIRPPLSIGGPTDRLSQLSQQHRAVEATFQAVLLLFYKSLNTSLSRPALFQRIPHQACVNASLPEVQLVVDTCLDLPGLAGDQCLCQDHMVKY